MGKLCCTFVFMISCLLTTHAGEAVSSAEPKAPKDGVIAIDVLLEPDATMVAKAKAVNAELRANYPDGYTLGSEQVPHITLLHSYVRKKDLAAIKKAVAQSITNQKVSDWPLTATGYGYGIWAGVAITSISVDRTPELDRLQEAVVHAVEPYKVNHGTKAAFSTT